MNDESRPPDGQVEDSEAPLAPDQNTKPAATSSRGLSPLALGLGFVFLALLGYIVFQQIIPAPKPARASESPRLQSLKADLEAQRQMLNRERMAMGKEPLPGSSAAESADAVAARVKEDAATLASLVSSFQDLLLKKDAELDESRSETIAALKEQRRMREMLEAANNDLRQSMIDASVANTMKAEMEKADARLAALQEELARLREEPERLRRQLIEANDLRSSLEARIAELESRLSRASLFAGTEEELLRDAVGLFRALRELEGNTDSEISAAYSQFSRRFGANVLKTCNFETGSADIPIELEPAILSIPSEAPPSAAILVVGYASETGDDDDNRRLSSARATAVAEVINASKKSGQRVQAVYLGQTDRFSTEDPLRNQIVEIWQIEPHQD